MESLRQSSLAIEELTLVANDLRSGVSRFVTAIMTESCPLPPRVHGTSFTCLHRPGPRLDADIIEVLGWRPLAKPGTRRGAGLLSRRGEGVPVIMSALAGCGQAATVTSTAALAVIARRPWAARVLGLILEQATETVHFDPRFPAAGAGQPAGALSRSGPVRRRRHGAAGRDR